MEDKRKYPRLNWSVVVHWEKVSDAPTRDKFPNLGASKDISAGGVRLILREGIEVGDILDLDIDLGGGKNFRGKGRVAWVEKFQITGWQDETGYEGGIEFIDITDEQRQELARFTMQSRKNP